MKFKIGSTSTLVATASAAILIFCHPTFAQIKGEAEQLPYSPLEEKAALELRSADLIDSEEYTPTIINADGKVENLPVRTRYYYAGNPTEKTVYQDGDDYANIEVLPSGAYRVYASDTFVHDPGTDSWREIENATIDPAAFDSVMQEQIDPTLGDLLSGTFHAHAQETIYSGSGDGWLRNSGATWSTVRSATAGSDANYTVAEVNPIQSTYAGVYYLDYVVLMFDTSALDGTVSDAVLHVKAGTVANSGLTVSLVESTITSNSSISTDDFELRGTTKLADDVSITTTGWKEWTLNSTGRGTIDTAGWSKFALTDVEDVENTQPNNDGYAYMTLSEAGGSDIPYLDVTVTVEEPPAATSTLQYASSTPGLSLETSIYFLLFAVVFTLGGLIVFSWFRDWFY